jgi:ABC-type phosphate/phosphonate transport system substrate-binding protein
MAKKIDSGSIKIDDSVVKKHEAAIEAMTEDEKTLAIATQLEVVEVGDKQKVFYRAKDVALAQQKASGILSVETARNKAQSDMEKLQQAWKDAESAGTWEIPQ